MHDARPANEKVAISTRKSPLALWQAEHVAARLCAAGLVPELLPVVTTGDKMQSQPLAEIHLPSAAQAIWETGKGLFVKEVQEALLDGRARLAVHSMKDLPVQRCPGLAVACVLPRGPVEDVLLLSPALASTCRAELALPAGAAFPPERFAELIAFFARSQAALSAPWGTTSARRRLLLGRLIRPDLPIVPLRGNVDSRLKRVEAGEFAAIVLARAGLERLGLARPAQAVTLAAHAFTPAPAQGALALEVNAEDLELRRLLGRWTCKESALAVALERASLARLGGDCHTAVGLHFSKGTLAVEFAAADGRSWSRRIAFPASTLTELETAFTQADGDFSLFEDALEHTAAATTLARGLEGIG